MKAELKKTVPAKGNKVFKKRPKYMLVEIGWPLKDIRAAAGHQNVSSAKFAQLAVKNAVERYVNRQNKLL